MRKIVVISFISLDGVIQAPEGPDEDTSGGFEFGGLTLPYSDKVLGENMMEQMSMPFDLLLGRKTYDIFANYWLNQSGPVADQLNKSTKSVLSRSKPDLRWKNTVLIEGDVVSKLTELKQQEGNLLQVHGSGDMIQTLLEHQLVDELWVKIFPVILGKGKRLVGENIAPTAFALINSKTTPKGVIFANYKKIGKVQTSSF